MLRKIRILLSTLFFIGITALLLDFSGTLHGCLGWMAKVQFLPALLAVNVSIVVVILLLTLLLGRVYCSVVCPLGVMQDIVSWLSAKRRKKNMRFEFSPAKTVLRLSVLVLFVAALVSGLTLLSSLLEPYSAYARVVTNIFAPLYELGNNALAYFAERADSYAFYTVEVWMKSVVIFSVAALTFAIVVLLAWKNGRTWCNTMCPIGTLLGCVARFSILKPVISRQKCSGCKVCARKCKASCINPNVHKIDYSRCVACMDCIESCKQGAISYKYAGFKSRESASVSQVDSSKRGFLSVSAIIATSSLLAQKAKVDGGLAMLEDKKIPKRDNPIIPVGAKNLRHFSQHCTACQLCVSKCPNKVLVPSSDINRLMQPEMSFERGFCRTACTKCAEVCPTGAIKPIVLEEKSSTKIGTAKWVAANCIADSQGVQCGNCQRHCPSGAIYMITKEGAGENAAKIPMIDGERCLGCGACEYVCPTRPVSAIYVEGHRDHRTI